MKTVKRFIAVLAVFLACAVMAGAETVMEQMEMLLQEGQKANSAAQYQKAIALLEKGLELAKQSENKQAMGAFIGSMGGIYNNLGQYEKALSYLEAALAIYKEIGDRRGEYAVRGNIGLVYDNLGQNEKALSHLEAALVIYKEIRLFIEMNIPNKTILTDFELDLNIIILYCTGICQLLNKR